MKKVTVRDANRGFSALLAQVERGEPVLITRRGNPVAILLPYGAPMTAPRQAAIDHARELMKKGLAWGEEELHVTRDEMHER